MAEFKCRYASLFSLVVVAFLLGFLTPIAAQATIPMSDSRNVEIIDPHDVLTANDETSLSGYTASAQLPAVIDDVVFLVWRDAQEPLNDFVVNYLKTNRSDLLSESGNEFANGTVIFVLATDSRLTGIYVGEDVDQAIGLRKDPDKIVDSMKPNFANGDWVNGLKTGVAAIEPYTPTFFDNYGGIILGATGGTVTLGISTWIFCRNRRLARREFDHISQNYGRLAQELTALDIRANNLNNPLVDAKLREEWIEIKEGFIGIHEDMAKLPATVGKVRNRHRPALKRITNKLNDLLNAEQNINTLFKLETGDHNARQDAAQSLHIDLFRSSMETGAQHKATIEALDKQCMELAKNPEDPAFLEKYVRLLDEYRVVLDVVKKEKFTYINDQQTAPSLKDSDWRPGYGYHGYAPFVLMQTWNDNNKPVSTTTSSGNSTLFSGGFSGAGSSGKF